MGNSIEKTIVYIPMDEFRNQVVEEILKLKPESSNISREIQFMAVSMLDRYLIKVKG